MDADTGIGQPEIVQSLLSFLSKIFNQGSGVMIDVKMVSEGLIKL